MKKITVVGTGYVGLSLSIPLQPSDVPTTYADVDHFISVMLDLSQIQKLKMV
jgi:UDP-N-acetyl-D-mannosaminuronate dehydrogenase